MKQYHWLSSVFAPLMVLGLITGRLSAVIASSPVQHSQSAALTQADEAIRQGLAAYQNNQLLEAIQYWENALSLYKTPLKQAQILINLAIAYYEIGQYINALEANQTALNIFIDLEREEEIGQVQSNLGNVYVELGDYDKAAEAYQESLRIARATENSVVEGASIGNLGYLYFLQGDLSTALEAYTQSLPISREVGDREGESYRLLNMGLVHHALKVISLAAENYQMSWEIAHEIGHRRLQAMALSHLGLTQVDRNNYDEAIAYFNQSLDILETLRDPDLKAKTLNNFGYTLLAANRLDEAEALLRKAIENLDSLRTDLDDAHHVSMFDSQIYTYNLLGQILIARNKPNEALEISEAGRARAITKLLMNQFTSPDDIESVSTSNTTATIDEIRLLAQERNITLVEYALIPEESFRQQGRQRGSTAKIHIWVVQPSGEVNFKQIELSPDEPSLQDLVLGSRRSMGVFDGRGGFQFVDEQSQDQLQTLHRLLIEPIAQWLPTKPEDPVVLIPQETLFLDPFVALQNESGDYLIEQHNALQSL